MSEVNFRLIATQIGDVLKYSITAKEIDRLGQSILKIIKENYPNHSISSVRASSVYNWILSLAAASMEPAERIKRLIQFCLELTPEDQQDVVIKILERNNCPYNLLYKDSMDEFLNRNCYFHLF